MAEQLPAKTTFYKHISGHSGTLFRGERLDWKGKIAPDSEVAARCAAAGLFTRVFCGGTFHSFNGKRIAFRVSAFYLDGGSGRTIL